MRLSAIRAIRFYNPGQGQPMISAITFFSGVSQMPVRYYFKTGWFFRYYVYSTIATLPLWMWISSKVNSPAAVAAWEAKKRSDAHKEHLAHMWKDIEGWNANK